MKLKPRDTLKAYGELFPKSSKSIHPHPRSVPSNVGKVNPLNTDSKCNLNIKKSDILDHSVNILLLFLLHTLFNRTLYKCK